MDKGTSKQFSINVLLSIVELANGGGQSLGTWLPA